MGGVNPAVYRTTGKLQSVKITARVIFLIPNKKSINGCPADG